MKPLYASFKRLNRCPCCQSRYSKKNDPKARAGKKAARARFKRQIKKELLQS